MLNPATYVAFCIQCCAQRLADTFHIFNCIGKRLGDYYAGRSSGTYNAGTQACGCRSLTLKG